jgi:hypothetical protein
LFIASYVSDAEFRYLFNSSFKNLHYTAKHININSNKTVVFAIMGKAL